MESAQRMTRLILLAGLLFVARCGTGGGGTVADPKLGGPCAATCDCKLTTKPLACAGEWACNASKVCEFTCRSSCNSSGVSTCKIDEDCNGTLCSTRGTCK